MKKILTVFACTSALLLAITQDAVNAFQLCPYGWTQSVVPGKCFRILRRKATAPEASEICRDYGGYLASIESAAEQDFILKYIVSDTDDWLRIGGRKNNATKAWFWEDGTPMKYTYWNADEANSDDARIFVFLYSAKQHEGTDSYGKWHAAKVNGPFEILCQLRLRMMGSGLAVVPCVRADPANNDNCLVSTG